MSGRDLISVCIVCVPRILVHRFGGNEGHDPHILYTLSALQVMALLGELDRVDKDKVWPPVYMRGVSKYTAVGGWQHDWAIVYLFNAVVFLIMNVLTRARARVCVVDVCCHYTLMLFGS